MKKTLILSGAVLATIILGLVSIFGLSWVKYNSTSLIYDLLVIFSWIILILISSWLVMSSLLPTKMDCKTDSGFRGSFTKHSVFRAIVVIFIVVFNFLWSNYVGGDFWFSYYSKVGPYITAKRSESLETKQWAIKKIANMAHPQLENLVDVLVDLQMSQDETIRIQAIAAMGYLAKRMRISMNLLQKEGNITKRFEYRVLAKIREVASRQPSLRTMGKEEKKAWMYVFGCLGEEQKVEEIREVVEKGDMDEKIEGVHALAYIGSMSALSALGKALDDKSIEVDALWAVGIITANMVAIDPKSAERSEEISNVQQKVSSLLAFASFEAKCVYVGLFPKIGDARLTHALLALVDPDLMKERCPRQERKRWFGPPEILGVEEDFFVLVLNAIASIAVSNQEIISFISDKIRDERFDLNVRARMKEILASVRL